LILTHNKIPPPARDEEGQMMPAVKEFWMYTKTIKERDLERPNE
jgi:hypothetical protein